LTMPMLHTIEVLKLKRVKDVDALLKELHNFENLKEVWLIHQETTDDQLQYLVQMKTLESLTIKRSFLTRASLKYFQQMPALKNLCLDRNDWTDEQKEDFKKQLPGRTVVFDSVVDRRFWHFGSTDRKESSP
jgi:hypothetical protein